jgi:alpha-beta hydrolase superfamily lysophospholipase
MSRAGEGPPGAVVERPVWLELSPDPVFAFLDLPEPERRGSTALLICPPFGWEEMCSHRARRAWARALARAGFPSARIDLPGEGESGGSPSDPQRLEAWTSAVSGSARWLRETTGASRVAAIGIGLGGMLACRAVALGAPIDDLILWAVPARGRAMVRELRAYAGIVAARYPDDAQTPPPDDGLEITGFLLTAESARDLGQLDLTELPVPNATERRVLMLGRDELGVDRRLRAHFEQAEAEVAVIDANDYSALMAHPQEAQTPQKSIDATIAWLRRTGETRPAAVGPSDPPPAAVSARGSVELSYDETAIVEAALDLPSVSGHSFGVLTTPADGDFAPVCAVLLNAGALRRIGPNRTWVEVARRWAARGVPTVRVDFEGIGDSDGDDHRPTTNSGLYGPFMVEQTRSLLRELSARDLPDRFVLVGLCSGAYWALHTALAEPRVAGSFMINLYSFYWSQELVAERDRRETVAALRGGVLKRLARGGVSSDQVRRALRGIRGGLRTGHRGSVEGAQESEVGLALDQLRDQHTQVMLLLSRGEPLYDQFEREGRIGRLDQWPNVELARIPSSDHMSRAIWLQRYVHDRLDRGLDRVLDSVRADAASRAQ